MMILQRCLLVLQYSAPSLVILYTYTQVFLLATFMIDFLNAVLFLTSLAIYSISIVALLVSTLMPDLA